MAKITQVKLFEASSLDPETAEKIAPLIDFCNSAFDQIIRAIDKKLTFGDNIDATIYTLKVFHGVKKDFVARDRQRLIGIAIIRVLDETDSVTSIHWSLNSAETVGLTCYFKEATSEARTVSALALYS